MKFLKKSVEVEAVLFTEDQTPEGVLYKGFNPATGEFKEAYVETPIGELPIKHGDYVIYENGKVYPCTPEAMVQNFIEPLQTEDKPDGYIDFKKDSVKHGDLSLNDEGCLVFSGSKEESAEDFMEYLQKNLIDPYIEKKTEKVTVDKAFALIDKQEIGTTNYFLNEAGRVRCSCCNKKGSGFLLLRNTMKPKRLYMREECVAKYMLAVEGNKNGN